MTYIYLFVNSESHGVTSNSSWGEELYVLEHTFPKLYVSEYTFPKLLWEHTTNWYGTQRIISDVKYNVNQELIKPLTSSCMKMAIVVTVRPCLSSPDCQWVAMMWPFSIFTHLLWARHPVSHCHRIISNLPIHTLSQLPPLLQIIIFADPQGFDRSLKH